MMQIKYNNKKIFFLFVLSALSATSFSQQSINAGSRQHLLMDFNWRFSFGHPYDPKKDFSNGTGYFSYFAKAGYGDGAAAADFDDRSWRVLNLPHDWAVEQNFDSTASFSHGFKAIGRNFPEASVGWYRKSFFIPAGDNGKRITVAFDGVFRNSIVWVNGHYLGTASSGYLGFEYDITDYLNYGDENKIAVRVDATMEEGWFYEGAGIYRHVWLNKTDPLHVISNGTNIKTKVIGNTAAIEPVVTITNYKNVADTFTLLQKIIDAGGKTVATGVRENISLAAFETNNFSKIIELEQPQLWDLEHPYLYTLQTTILKKQSVIDQYSTRFGVRSIFFDADKGFFLNGKHVEIKGTNNHQDHAGVGTAMPDALQDFRIATLKSFGCNAYRCSHNPPTPELLDACDRLGMLVIDENRLMGITAYHLDAMKHLIERDRNHPCVISWSIGNEEWAIENNNVGARIATAMQNFVKTLDSSRPVTLAFSGGVGSGNSTTIEMLGYNYIANKNTDEQHKKFPSQLSWGTEEGSTVATRGIYFNDTKKHYRRAYDEPQFPKDFFSIEQGWKYYAARPYLCGMYIWTGFDYRGEPTPFGWPSVTSLFGMADLCGFLKDDAYYLKAWWLDKPVLHLLPHWTWPGKEGQEISVWAYSNCDEVELFMNKKSLGRKMIEKNGHLEWKIKYVPGMLEAIGYNKNKPVAQEKIQTTGKAETINITSNKTTLLANREDISLLTVEVLDKNNLHVPVADDEIYFSITGPAKIIGVGNGDQTSLEKDKFLSRIDVVKIENFKEKYNTSADTLAIENTNDWQQAFTAERTAAFADTVKNVLYRGSFTLPGLQGNEMISFFYKSLGKIQSVFINGNALAHDLLQNVKGNSFQLKLSMLHAGENTVTIVSTPILKVHSWDVINTDPGLIQIMRPAHPWKRKLFNGLAQVIIQATDEPGDIIISATSGNLKIGSIKIKSLNTQPRPSVDE